MQHKNDKTIQLRNAIGKVIKQYRENNIKLSCNGMENAFDFSSGSISKIEKCVVDCKMISFWKIAEAAGIRPSELLSLVETELGDKFKLIDE